MFSSTHHRGPSFAVSCSPARSTLINSPAWRSARGHMNSRRVKGRQDWSGCGQCSEPLFNPQGPVSSRPPPKALPRQHFAGVVDTALGTWILWSFGSIEMGVLAVIWQWFAGWDWVVFHLLSLSEGMWFAA